MAPEACAVLDGFLRALSTEGFAKLPKEPGSSKSDQSLGGFIPIGGEMIQFDKHIFPIG